MANDLHFILGGLYRVDDRWPGPPRPLQAWNEDTEAWDNIGLPKFRVLDVGADTTLPSAPLLAVLQASGCTITLPDAVTFDGLQVVVKVQDHHDTLVQAPGAGLIDGWRAQRRINCSYRTMVYLAAGGVWWEVADIRMTE